MKDLKVLLEKDKEGDYFNEQVSDFMSRLMSSCDTFE